MRQSALKAVRHVGAARTTIARGPLGEPRGVRVRGDPEPPDTFRIIYRVDNSPAGKRPVPKGAAYPVGAVKPQQVVVLRPLNRHLTPADFARTVPNNLRGPIRGPF